MRSRSPQSATRAWPFAKPGLEIPLDLAVYTVIFKKKNVLETITMAGTTTDYETLKAVVRKAADRKVKNSGLMTNTLRGLEIMYEDTGNFFKQSGGGYRGYIFTGNLEMMKKIGLRTKQRIILYNGDIECRLLEYELYKGSRKTPVI